MFKRIHGSVQFVRWSLDLGINLNVALETDVWKTPWHGPLFNSPHRESIPLLKMRLFFLLKIESQKCHIPYSWTFFCERDHSPSISSFFFFSSWEHNWPRINLMFCRGHPVLWLTERVKPATFPAVIPRTKVIAPTSCCLQGASPWIGSYCWCHAAVCSNSELRLARGRRLADMKSSGCIRMQGGGWREERQQR